MSRKIRVAAAGVLAAAGVSLGAAMLTPGVALADPWNPVLTNPNHPVMHYIGDLQHPVWAVTHPIRATDGLPGVDRSTTTTTTITTP